MTEFMIACLALVVLCAIGVSAGVFDLWFTEEVRDMPEAAQYGLKKDGTPKAKPGRKVGFKAKKPEPVANSG